MKFTRTILTAQFAVLVCTAALNSKVVNADQVIHCDSCSISQVKAKVKAQQVQNTYYVLDFQSHNVHLYDWYIVDLDGRIEKRLLKMQVPLAVSRRLNDFFNARQAFQRELNSNPSLLSELVSQLSVSTADKVIADAINGAIMMYSNENGNITAYEFMTTSSKRKDIFNKLLTFYPSGQSAINAWNSFAQFSTISVGPASVSSSWLTRPQTINFPNGSVLQVVVSPTGDSFNVVEGSAYDSSGNQIPNNRRGFAGNFVFDGVHEQNEFTRYGNYYDIEFIVSRSCFADYRTTCRVMSNNRYVCTLTQIC